MKHSPLSSLLRDKDSIYAAADQSSKQWIHYLLWFALISLLGMAGFGALMSTHIPHWWHALTLAWKMIVLIWGPLLICAPALFVFGAIRGSKIKLTQMVVLLFGSMATSGVVLLALTPLTGFFTWTSDTLGFLRVMNGMFIGLALAFGMFFFAKGLLYIHKAAKARGEQSSAAVDIVVLWFVLLIIVVAQMSMKLGPWYELRTVPVEFTQGDMVFPSNPKGNFIEEPTLSQREDGTTVVTWSVSEYCGINEVEYVQADYNSPDDTWGGVTAECVDSFNNPDSLATSGEVTCTAVLPKHVINGQTWKLQASSENCNMSGPLSSSDNNKVSQVINYP